MKLSLKYLPIFFVLAYSLPLLADDNKHHVPGVFVGYTHAADETHFTYGIEYEYKINKNWGIGAVYEKIDDAHHHDGVNVMVAEVFYHPSPSWRFGVGAGKEKIGGHHPHSEDLYRLSINYDLHIGDFGIAPTLAVDFIDGEEAYVFGVALIRPF